jgi:hypothetical protein
MYGWRIKMSRLGRLLFGCTVLGVTAATVYYYLEEQAKNSVLDDDDDIFNDDFDDDDFDEDDDSDDTVKSDQEETAAKVKAAATRTYTTIKNGSTEAIHVLKKRSAPRARRFSRSSERQLPRSRMFSRTARSKSRMLCRRSLKRISSTRIM